MGDEEIEAMKGPAFARRARVRAAAWLLLGGLASSPARGDDVHLTNGETFAGVAAEVAGAQVRILMAGGEMRLPRSLVARIEESAAPYREYLERKAALRAADDAEAGAWLELARWALAADLRSSAREAARTAALLDPELPGLAPVMRRLGLWRSASLVHPPAAVPPDPAGGAPGEVDLRRQVAAEIRRAAEEARRREEDLADARREAAAEVRRVFDEARARPSSEPQPGLYVTAPIVYAVPVPIVVVRAGMFPPGPPAAPSPPPVAEVHSRGPVLDLLERQPGSLIPGVLDLGKR